jgi:hypothetical protein
VEKSVRRRSRALHVALALSVPQNRCQFARFARALPVKIRPYPAQRLHGTSAVWSKIKALLCLKRDLYGLRMNEESSPALMALCYFSQGTPRINPSRLTTNAASLSISDRSCETWHGYC